MKFIKYYWKVGFVLILAPIFINYALLSWRAPYVSGTTVSWLAFFGSYLGLLGAISISVISFNRQREKENARERESNRSYIVLHDFHTRIKLPNVKTHENSRIILTKGYSDLLELTKNETEHNTSYLKISHFGKPELIFNCRIQITATVVNGGKTYNIDSNVGVIEKGIELFVPVVNPNPKIGDEVVMDQVVIEYSTLSNERLRYEHNFKNSKEVMSVIDDANQIPTVLQEFDLISSNWTYPNKLNNV